nr:MAG TPA: hypothetical protein [Caudoviricetes sp.]
MNILYLQNKQLASYVKYAQACIARAIARFINC